MGMRLTKRMGKRMRMVPSSSSSSPKEGMRMRMIQVKKERKSMQDDDVASTTLITSQGHLSQDSPQEIVPQTVTNVPHYPMLTFPPTDHPVSESLSSPHPPLELQHETDPNRCFSGLRMGESISLPRSHSLPSLRHVQCIKNKARLKAKRSHSLNDVTLLDKTQKMTPDIIIVDNKEIYRFRCTQAGLFQCRVTGLAFKMEAETEVTYRIVPWNQRLYTQPGKRPAGPLFDIRCPQGSVCQLHFPHCEILSSMGGGNTLYVAHVMADDGIEFIRPDVITETHVIINITEFSPFGVVIAGVKQLVNSVFNSLSTGPIRALVLPFYTPPADDNTCSILKVLLLPGNVVLDDVLNVRRKRDLDGGEIYIEVPPCKLIPNQEYTLSTDLQHDSTIIQPEKTTFEVDESSYVNYLPTFNVVFLKGFKSNVRLLLKPLSHSQDVPAVDNNTSDCAWDCYVPLSAPALRKQQIEHKLSLEVEDRLYSVRRSFIDSISAPNLKYLVDKLFEKKLLTDFERETAEGMQRKDEKATFVIDTVRKKGGVASSHMVLMLCDIDPFLSEHLRLV